MHMVAGYYSNTWVEQGESETKLMKNNNTNA